MIDSSEKHVHLFDKVTTEKVVLFNADGAALGWDIFTFKNCKCGRKEPIKTERHKR